MRVNRDAALLIRRLVLIILMTYQTGCAQPIAVRIVDQDGNVAFCRAGNTFRARGAAGPGSIELLAESGANATRTWSSSESTGEMLDAASALGLSVCLGIKFTKVNDGFDYEDAEQCAEHLESVRTTVMRYRDHPAVLVWGLGNEMELGAPDRDEVWDHVERAAALVKSLDADHPTMTVIAEIGGTKVAEIHERCPSIDIIGINSYRGAASLPLRYRDAGGTKPFLVTEFGTNAPYEAQQTEWGMPIESSSTEKAAQYRRAYDSLRTAPNCLGAFAFVWGHKEQGSRTWHGMFLEDGSTLQAVDEMTLAWGGVLWNRSPRISSFYTTGPTLLRQGEHITATVVASDPDGDKLSFEYILVGELPNALGGNTTGDPPGEYSSQNLQPEGSSVTLTAPRIEGPLRLYVIVRDREGSAATASIPLCIEP
ncbi:MAG: glycoside hydrolase family 2 TIM barrel-domain containing protein [Planctomycetota bacterium]